MVFENNCLSLPMCWVKNEKINFFEEKKGFDQISIPDLCLFILVLSVTFIKLKCMWL